MQLHGKRCVPFRHFLPLSLIRLYQFQITHPVWRLELVLSSNILLTSHQSILPRKPITLELHCLGSLILLTASTVHWGPPCWGQQKSWRFILRVMTEPKGTIPSDIWNRHPLKLPFWPIPGNTPDYTGRTGFEPAFKCQRWDGQCLVLTLWIPRISVNRWLGRIIF